MFGECVVVGVEQLSLCLVSMLFYVAALCKINSIYIIRLNCCCTLRGGGHLPKCPITGDTSASVR